MPKVESVTQHTVSFHKGTKPYHIDTVADVICNKYNNRVVVNYNRLQIVILGAKDVLPQLW